MTRRRVPSVLCAGIAVLGVACATKSFVQEPINATENRLTQQMTTAETNLPQRAAIQETKLRETADRSGENRQAIGVADQRLNGLDLRVGELGARASSPETRADLATAALGRDAVWRTVTARPSRTARSPATAPVASTATGAASTTSAISPSKTAPSRPTRRPESTATGAASRTPTPSFFAAP